MTVQRDSAKITGVNSAYCQEAHDMKLDVFFSQHPVFTVGELDRFLSERGHTAPNPRTRTSLLWYHQRHGRIVLVRRGLYAVVPLGASPETSPVDPYLVASRASEDAILAYRTALELRGKSYSTSHRFFCLTARRSLPFRFRSYEIRPVLFPKPVLEKGKADFATELVNRAGLSLRVTSLERTLVDLLQRPDLGGGWEEVWRSLESVEFFNLDLVLEYVLLLDNATTAARVGFFLEQHSDSLMVDAGQLEPLRRLRPRQPHHLDRRRRTGRLVSEWNLIVPTEILERSWAEVA